MNYGSDAGSMNNQDAARAQYEKKVLEKRRLYNAMRAGPQADERYIIKHGQVEKNDIFYQNKRPEIVEKIAVCAMEGNNLVEQRNFPVMDKLQDVIEDIESLLSFKRLKSLLNSMALMMYTYEQKQIDNQLIPECLNVPLVLFLFPIMMRIIFDKLLSESDKMVKLKYILERALQDYYEQQVLIRMVDNGLEPSMDDYDYNFLYKNGKFGDNYLFYDSVASADSRHREIEQETIFESFMTYKNILSSKLQQEHGDRLFSFKNMNSQRNKNDPDAQLLFKFVESQKKKQKETIEPVITIHSAI